MAISQNFPTTRPSLNLNFARSRKLDSRVTFTRGSTGTYVDESGLIRTAGINEARFDYDPISGESLGLLIEESRSNLITYSEDISQYQFIENASVTTNSIVAPDGTTTADTLTSTVDGGTNTCMVQKYAAVPYDTSTYTFSVFLKSGTSPITTINLQLAGGTYQQSVATINWTSNTITFSTGGTSSLVSYPNGWYRLSITLTNNGTNNAIYPRIYVRDQGSSNVSGHNVYIWGWQTEAGSFPTSYIPTEASQVTRSADNASITGTNFTDCYNQIEGSYKVEGFINATLPTNTYGGIFGAGGGSGTSNFIFLNPSNSFGQYVSNISQTPSSTLGKIYTNGAKIKISASYLEADFACSFNGDISNSSTSGALYGSMTYFGIGNNPITNLTFGSMSISSISYYPKQITDTQLQTLTK